MRVDRLLAGARDVGHPLGFIGTDVYARFKRMTGYNVLHAMGFDAFGLPAEIHARAAARAVGFVAASSAWRVGRISRRDGAAPSGVRSISNTFAFTITK